MAGRPADRRLGAERRPRHATGWALGAELFFALSRPPVRLSSRIEEAHRKRRCWQVVEPKDGEAVRDSYNYQGVVWERILHEGRLLGIVIDDIQHLHELKELSRKVPVICLRALLEASFEVTFRPGARPSKGTTKGKGKR